ncbi:hypothetical protein DCMF_05790 [Candidatus Formimonas warabiya]|uniref:HAD family hydrolase n=1 Tax=Formimonas warabiya TaxID=1761012 RepID=A0A3G1KPH2_FORW1|nr:hypothetical protein DCMF_05790 [Candidatus Formimonas warabiya]
MIFDDVKLKFLQTMQEWNLGDGKILDTLNYYDIENVKKCGGFAKECFPQALVQTYLHYCAHRGEAACQEKMKEMEELGWKALYQKPELLEGAEEVLERLSYSYQLFLITKGDQELQTLKISQSGLKDFFTRIYVVLEKNDHVFRGIMEQHAISPKQSWSVGNSIKADINPALRAGMNCIHVLTPSWDFEHEESQGEYYQVDHLREIISIIEGKNVNAR